MAQAKDTFLEREVEGPYVKSRVGDWGHVSAEISCWRRKANGAYEHVTLKFGDLDGGQLACIGRKVRQAMEQKRAADNQANGYWLRQITGESVST
jgi:hypothetical protein